MAKLSRSEKLERALSAILASHNSNVPATADKELRPVLQIAAELRGLPREEFKARLKSALKGNKAMTSENTGTAAAVETTGSWIREGFRSITPYLIVERAADFMAFAAKVFGAEERMRVPRPGTDLIMHAEMQLGDSIIEFADASAHFPARPTSLHLFTPDPDAVYNRAIAAGAKSIREPSDLDYGERSGSVIDAFGNRWYIAKAIGEAAAKSGSYVWEGLHDVNVCLAAKGTGALIEFMKDAFGATEMSRAEEHGVIHYAASRISDAVIELCEAQGPYQPQLTGLHLYVPNVDEV